MIGVRDDDHQYRRGMVLGLTMAEVMLLLIFVLLLLLAAKLLADRKALADAIQARDEAVAARISAEDKYAGIERMLREQKIKEKTVYDILEEYQKAEKRLEEAERQIEEAKSAMELLESIKKLNQGMTDEEATAEIQRLIEVAQAIERQAAEIAPSANREEALGHLLEAALVGDQALDSGKSPEELIAGASCQKDLEQCKASNISIANQLAQKGGTLPSCWIDPMTGKPQYIFTAILRNNGIYLLDNKVPGREEDQAKLPIAPLIFEHPYQAAAFVQAGRGLYDWSASQDPACRFYVRLIDETANDKVLYKRLKERGVEGVFYTYPVTTN